MTKKKIGLVGFFGWGNFGDELFLKAHHHYLGSEFDLEVVHDILERPYFSRPIEEVVSRYDGFLIGGGDLVNPVRVSELYWKMEYLNKPVFVFGIGVPGTKHQRRDAVEWYRRFFQHPNCKLVVPRDPESLAWIEKSVQPSGRLEWYPDPVCALPRPPAPVTKDKVLGVVMRSHRSMSDDLSQVRKLIDHAKTLDYTVRHLVLGTESTGEADAQVAKLLAADDEEVVVASGLDDLCVQIASCSMLATIKFHGVVVAAMYGIPSIAMSVTPKNRNFLRLIGRPEMLGGYTQLDIWKKLSYYPAPIHSLVRGKLFRDSKRGYEVLLGAMRDQFV